VKAGPITGWCSAGSTADRCTRNGSPAHSGIVPVSSGYHPIRLHDLRHGWATLALATGVHPKVVQERLGHATIGVTLDIYSHVTAGMHSDAAEQVAAAIFEGS
jgi:integrase